MKEINDVHINIPDYICEFIKRLSEVGIGCCLVGGCVRDYFLGMVSEDFDLHCGCDMELFKDKIDGLEIICKFELEKASESSLEFWNNTIDDEVWNDVKAR